MNETIGTLDLSRRGLNKFPTELEENDDLDKVKKLNLSNNIFQTLEGLARFPAVSDIDASSNELHRLACFLSVKGTLQHLNVASNQICAADNLNSLEALQTLNLASNKLEQFPVLDRLMHLRELDLSGNRLTKLPNLSHLPSLVSLSLRELRISSLADATKYLPKSLRSLDISSNLIRDLTEALLLAHLQDLESLRFTGNPCVSADARAFDYRPYLLNCCLSLKEIDGFVVSEKEQLRGEWLYSQGKGRQFKPGSGKQLTEYLTTQCPITLSDRPLSTSFEDKLVKVLQKRKQHLNESEMGNENAISDMVSASQKENRAPSQPECNSALMMSSSSMSTVLSPRQESVAEHDSESSDKVKNPYDAYDQRPAVASFLNSFVNPLPTTSSVSVSARSSVSSRLMQSTSAKKTTAPLMKPMMSPSSKTSSRGKMTPSPSKTTSSPGKVMSPQSRTTSSLAKETSPSKMTSPLRGIPSSMKVTKMTSPAAKLTSPVTSLTANATPRVPTTAGGFASRPLTTPPSAVSASVQRRPTLKEQQAGNLIQAWWRGVLARKALRPRLMELRALRAEQYVASLIGKVAELDEKQEKTVQLNEELTTLVQQLAVRVHDVESAADARLKRLETAMTACLPTPSELTIERRDDKSAVLRWQLAFPISQVKGYSLLVDGEICGEVTAVNQSAMITDLDFSQQHQVAVQAISACAGLRSRLSQAVKIEPEPGRNRSTPTSPRIPT